MNLLRGMIVSHAVLHKSYMIIGFDSVDVFSLAYDPMIDDEAPIILTRRFLSNARDTNGKLIKRIITPCK